MVTDIERKELEKTSKIRFMYYSSMISEDCEIQANQIKVLTLINLPNLEYLKLSNSTDYSDNNNIGSEGAHRLL